MEFLPLGNSTKSHGSFLSKDSISSTKAYFQSLPYVESTSSPTDLGSLSMVVNTNAERNSDRLYLSTGFLTHSDLLTMRVGFSTSSSDSVDSF
jgi:hypothetical protein